MGRFFSDEVEQALEYIYYNVRLGKGQEGFQLLEKASAAGDGDASCILARCYAGPQYVWREHGFPEDDDRVVELLHKSVEQKSAIGVLVSIRCGELSEEREKTMPFSSLQEVFDIVLEKAMGGEPFCQYCIGNTYFWWDFIRIQKREPDTFPSTAEFRKFVMENLYKCEDWFKKAYEGGLYHAGNNLRNFYLKGEEGLVPARPELAKEVFRIGAEKGYPIHQLLWAEELEKQDKKEEALQLYKLAADGGQRDAWYYIAQFYEEGKVVEQDIPFAIQCYERCLDHPDVTTGCHNALGKIYYTGNGVPQDHVKGYEYMKYAYDRGSKWGLYWLGRACFTGEGTKQDYFTARKYFEEMNWNYWHASYMLGYIYCHGLDVPEDIEKGVGLLQKAGTQHPEVAEELKNYKKTLFGKWKRK